MPPQAEWLHRVPDILAVLEQVAVPVVDRAAVEKLFGLKRRRAIVLMHKFGGYQAGRTFLIDRLRLLEALAALQGGGDFQFEQRRRERLEKVFDESREYLRTRQIAIPMPPSRRCFSLDHLDAGVCLVPGVLSIEFQEPIELLQKLYALSQAIGHDFELFEDMVKLPRENHG